MFFSVPKPVTRAKNVEHFISSKAWLHGYDESGEIPLQKAVAKLDEVMVAALIKSGANLDVSWGGVGIVALEQLIYVFIDDKRGQEAKDKIFKISQMLLRFGANPQLVDISELLNYVIYRPDSGYDELPRQDDRNFVAAYIGLLLHHGAEFNMDSVDADEENEIELIINTITEQYNLMTESQVSNIYDIGREKHEVWVQKNAAAARIQKLFKQSRVDFIS